MHADLAHVRTWIFDLDNTLYPAASSLFPTINARMTDFIATNLDIDPVEARRIQKAYFFEHGTTLAGLMANHAVDAHAFLDYVHDVDLSLLSHDAALVAAIGRLPGRKLVFTNGDIGYARRVLDRIGMTDSFEGIHDVHAMAYRPKPDPVAYQGLCDAHGIVPREALFVEDMARNLKPAKAIGMTTVWIDNGSEQAPCEDRSYIDYSVRDLGGWLANILEEQA